MTNWADQHAEAARKLLVKSEEAESEHARLLVAQAQVHATLAVAAQLELGLR